MSEPFLDIHLHLQSRREDWERARDEVARLRRRGAELLVFYRDEVDPEVAPLYKRLLRQAPVVEAGVYGLGGDAGSFEGEVAAWRYLNESFGDPDWLAFFPLIIFPHQMNRGRIQGWAKEGCAGIKLVEIRGELEGAEAIDGDDHRLAARAEVFEATAELGLSLTLHADLRRHGDWIWSLIEANPTLKVNLAHFGYSRRRAAEFLERWPERVFTDTANLARRAEADPDGYREFFRRYPDQIVFGSDAFLGDLSAVGRHLEMVQTLAEPSVARRVLVDNPRRMLARPRANLKETAS